VGKKRITGNDRALMFLCAAGRKYWRFYSPAHKEVKQKSFCDVCKKKVDYVEVDHTEPVGSRPREFKDMGAWLERLFYLPLQGLCKKHHQEKTARERQRRKDNVRKAG
jgi:hypothetical protein